MKKINNIKVISACLATVMGLTSISFMTVSAVSNTTILKVKSTMFGADEIPDNHQLSIDITISGNKEGFRASSFGIKYSPDLIYVPTNETDITPAGKAFVKACNPEEHIIWFTYSSSSSRLTANTLQEELLTTVTFTLPEHITGGTFPIEFIWDGLDGSSAYWYTQADRNSNIISEIKANAVSGSVGILNPDDETLNYTEIRMNRDTQEQLTVSNAAGNVIWFSSNPSVASVDNNGLVTAVTAGECDIQAFVDNHILVCHVTVSKGYYYAVTDPTELTLTNPEDTIILEYPGADNVSWISTAPDIVGVEADGTLLPLKNGTAHLLGTYDGKTYMKTIIVDYQKLPDGPLTETLNETVAPFEEYQSGDTNGDNEIDIRDVILVNKAIFGKENLTEAQLRAADINGNQMPDAEDSLAIMKKVVKMA